MGFDFAQQRSRSNQYNEDLLAQAKANYKGEPGVGGVRGFNDFVKGSEGLRIGNVASGTRNGIGSGNSNWMVNPDTGREERAFAGSDGLYYLESDLIKGFGSVANASKAMGAAHPGVDDRSPLSWSRAQQSNDTFSGKDGLQDLITIGSMAAVPWTAGALGAGGLAGAGEAGAGAAAGDAAFAGGVGTDAMSGGGAMGDWWSELGLTAEDVGMGSSGAWSTNPSMADLGGNFNGMDTSGFGGDFSADAYGGQQYDATGFGSSFDNPDTLPNGDNSWSLPKGITTADLLKYGSSALKGVLGKAQGMLPSMDTAAGLAPGLAAIAYAKNQGPFDTSRMQSLYDQYNPQALAGQYDINTGMGRTSLESSNAARGLSGSTFGNDSMNNFNTSRDIGRSQLVSQGALGANSIASSILDAQIKHRALQNDLYGRALYSIGNVFGGKR